MKLLIPCLLISLTGLLSAQGQNPTETIGSKYNVTTNQWENNLKTVASYNADHTTVNETYSSWSISESQWKQTFKTDYTYDSNGNLNFSISSNYLNNTWVQSTKSIETYNASRKLTNQLDQDWRGTDWVNSNQTNYYYTDGTLEYTEQQTWTGGIWVNSLKEVFTYDGQGKETVRVVHTWNGSSYITSTRTSSTWDQNGNLLEELVEVYGGGIWVLFQKFVRTYTTNNQVALFQENSYNHSTSKWVPVMRVVNTFNSSNVLTLSLWEKFVDPDWVKSYKNEYTYFGATGVKTESIPSSGFELANNYPNPFNPVTTISFSLPENLKISLTVHDITGKTIAVLAEGNYAAGSYKKVFNAGRLASGAYFYRLQTSGFTMVKKMLLLK